MRTEGNAMECSLESIVADFAWSSVRDFAAGKRHLANFVDTDQLVPRIEVHDECVQCELTIGMLLYDELPCDCDRAVETRIEVRHGFSVIDLLVDENAGDQELVAELEMTLLMVVEACHASEW